MRIAHICPSSFTDGLTYQENLLVKQNRDDGHEVLVIASTESVDERTNTKLVQNVPGRSTTSIGIDLVRLPYRKGLPLVVARKVRALQGLRHELEQFDPDVVLFHCGQSWEILTLRDFARAHQSSRCFVDFHSDPFWSGRSVFSRVFLHRIFYRWLIRRSLPSLQPPLCISIDVQNFVSEMYGLPRESLEFFPLGGFVYNDVTYKKLRDQGRARLGVRADQLLLLQTGKFDRRKKLVESLRAFQAADIKDAVFVIAGAIGPDIADEAALLIDSQPNVRNLGWVGSDALFELLCACDCYIQPGTQSATMQLALCARCPVLLDDVPSHVPFIDGNGWLIRSKESLEVLFRQIDRDRASLPKLSEQSLYIAQRLLDYKSLAARLYR
jgi:hypothetical protein